MADKYGTFDQLQASEVEGKDYRREAVIRESSIAIIAPHGGGIEPGTSEIAREIAGQDLSLYLFEGLKRTGNGDLHITSTNFNEPYALQVVDGAKHVIAIHGEGGAKEAIYLGGRDKQLVHSLDVALSQAGFSTARHTNSQLQGVAPTNICNRGMSNMGAQLEFSRGIRAQLFDFLDQEGRVRSTETFDTLIGAIRKAIDTK